MSKTQVALTTQISLQLVIFHFFNAFSYRVTFRIKHVQAFFFGCKIPSVFSIYLVSGVLHCLSQFASVSCAEFSIITLDAKLRCFLLFMVVGSRVEYMNLPRFAAGDTMEGDNSFIPVENELVRFSTDTLLPFTWSVPVGDVVSST